MEKDDLPETVRSAFFLLFCNVTQIAKAHHAAKLRLNVHERFQGGWIEVVLEVD